MDKKKILIIDDEAEFVDMLKIRLKASGYEVEVAYDGEGGLKLSKTAKPDLILLDIMLPKIDGYEICSLIRKDGNGRRIPIILLTALDQNPDSFKEVGADFCIIKPFEPEALLKKIRELIKKSNTEDGHA